MDHQTPTCWSCTDSFLAYERFAILMAANPRDEERRAQLNKEKETIQKAQERIEGLSLDDMYE